MFAIYYVLCLTTVFMFLTLAHPFEPVANASNSVLVRRQRSGRTPQPYDYTCGSDCEGASLITFLKACVQLIIDKVSDEQHKKEEQFTQSQLDQLRKNWPHLNAAIIQGKHDYNLVGKTHDHAELDLGIGPQTQGYEIYTFESGDITLSGDGGFINWRFGGN